MILSESNCFCWYGRVLGTSHPVYSFDIPAFQNMNRGKEWGLGFNLRP